MTMPEQVTRIAVKVVPGTANSAISRWHDECLRVRLSTAPELGKANSALIAMLAKSLGLPGSAITIIKGQHALVKSSRWRDSRKQI